MSIGQSESPSSIAEVMVGTVLAGKYRVDSILGRGGMGIVVAATHLELETSVAIKLLLPEVRTNQEVVTRFAREARASAQIKSEFVARTIDVGKLDNGCPYIVMEYLDGTDLAHRIADRGPLPIAEAVRWILQACDALAEAHALGIIHRDLKPSNLFVTRRRDGTEIAKMLDFGISKLSMSGATGPEFSMTRTTSVMGSPLYMSPEQLVAARNVDPRSDIWALGVTLYEALAGVPPFNGDSLPELCAKVMTQPAPSLVALRPELPPELEAVISRCLAKEPAQRYASATDLAAALLPFAPTLATGVGHRPLETASKVAVGSVVTDGALASKAPVLAASAPTVNSWGQTNGEGTARASKWLPMAVAMAAIAAIGLGIVVWRSRTTVSESSAVASVPSRAIHAEPARERSVAAVVALPSSSVASMAAGLVVSPVGSPTNGNSAAQATAPPIRQAGPTDRSSRPSNVKSVKPAPQRAPRNNDLFGDRN